MKRMAWSVVLHEDLKSMILSEINHENLKRMASSVVLHEDVMDSPLLLCLLTLQSLIPATHLFRTIPGRAIEEYIDVLFCQRIPMTRIKKLFRFYPMHLHVDWD